MFQRDEKSKINCWFLFEEQIWAAFRVFLLISCLHVWDFCVLDDLFWYPFIILCILIKNELIQFLIVGLLILPTWAEFVVACSSILNYVQWTASIIKCSIYDYLLWIWVELIICSFFVFNICKKLCIVSCSFVFDYLQWTDSIFNCSI